MTTHSALDIKWASKYSQRLDKTDHFSHAVTNSKTTSLRNLQVHTFVYSNGFYECIKFLYRPTGKGIELYFNWLISYLISCKYLEL